MKHTSVESEDLPTYFRSQYQWTQSARTSPAPAKGRKAVLNAVSSEAPISFQIKHAQVLTPERKRAALLGSAAKPSRDQRLMQDLNSHSATRFLRFTYSDFRSTTDLNSIPLGRGVDLLTDHNAGARSRISLGLVADFQRNVHLLVGRVGYSQGQLRQAVVLLRQHKGLQLLGYQTLD